MALTLEELEERGIMDERDADYLEHLEVPAVEINDVATEGIIRAVAHDAASTYTDAYREIKGWFIGIESKRKELSDKQALSQDAALWNDPKAAETLLKQIGSLKASILSFDSARAIKNPTLERSSCAFSIISPSLNSS